MILFQTAIYYVTTAFMWGVVGPMQVILYSPLFLAATMRDHHSHTPLGCIRIKINLQSTPLHLNGIPNKNIKLLEYWNAHSRTRLRTKRDQMRQCMTSHPPPSNARNRGTTACKFPCPAAMKRSKKTFNPCRSAIDA